VSVDGRLLQHRVLTSQQLSELELPEGARVLVGDGTGSGQLLARLAELGVSAELVPEDGTSLEARDLYYQRNQPRGWARLVPLGFRVPPVPIDDYAAYAIALRWLRSRHDSEAAAG
jgi:hypothetical protein